MRQLSKIDDGLGIAQRMLGVLMAAPVARRPMPQAMHKAYDAADGGDNALSDDERALAAALMRVNHVGEVCAQALYEAQALGTDDPSLKQRLLAAAAEETDHLAWTQQRIDALNGRTSLLNPLWLAGAFSLGLVAARFGDRVSLGFMAETERQVEQHLGVHLERLPARDHASRAIVEQMQRDEAQHGEAARQLGGLGLPLPVRLAMRAAARVMTRTAHYL